MLKTIKDHNNRPLIKNIIKNKFNYYGLKFIIGFGISILTTPKNFTTF
jgi:hypothetical protein